MSGRYNSDIGFGGLLLLVGSGLLILTFDARYADQAVGAVFSTTFYPRIVLTIWVGLSILILLRGVLTETSASAAPNVMRFVALCALLVAVIVLLPQAGFLLASTAFLLLAPPILGYRRPVPWLMTAAVFPVSVWHVFNNLLKIPLPASTWIAGI